MKHLDLFSGIGGFALAAKWMNWETIGFVEIDKFCQKVLTKNFPNIPIHGDIKTFNGTHLRGTVDILTGGFPCQPYSQSGKRKGNEDPRHLWPEMLRIIGEIQPCFIVGENVSGLVNWSGGLVFEQVQTDLENEGYEVTSFLLPACSTGAWHSRERIWFIAYLNSDGFSYGVQRKEKKREGETCNPIDKRTSNHNSIGCKRGNKELQEASTHRHGTQGITPRELRDNWKRDGLPSPTILRVDDGLPNGLDRIKGLGNAVVPHVVLEIYKAIEQLRVNCPSVYH